MADYGLIGGLAEGLKQGLLTYRDEKRRQEDLEDKRRKMIQEDEDRNQRLQLINEQRMNEKMRLGLKEDPENPGQWIQDPESLAAQRFEAENAAKGLIKTDQGYQLAPEIKQAKDLETKEKQARIGLLSAQAQKAKAEAEKPMGRAAGKPLTISAAENLGSSQLALKSLEDLKSLSGSNPEMFGKGVGLIGNLGIMTGIGDTATKAASIDADLMSKAQVIGRYLEGGKLAEGDIARYSKMLPQRGDKPEIVDNKIKTLERMIQQKYNTDLQGYKASGYDIGENQPVELGAGLIKGVSKTPDTKVWQGVTYKRIGDKWVAQ